MLDAARNINDLRSHPGNRLEALRGDWRGFHSIRINDQWRLVFRWAEGQAHEVRVIDYRRG
jgi:proteic killer suppression protein